MSACAVEYRRSTVAEPLERSAPSREATVADLVVSARDGHHAAFTALYMRFHRVVHAVVLARVAPADAGDLVQDTFAEAWLRLAGLREPEAFPGWLLAIARNRAVDHLRRPRRVVADASAAEPAVDAPPRAEAAQALRAICELPDTYRETLIMRLVEGLTGPEIAARTGMTPDSVRVHLHRGMKLLRERLGGTV
jgi:RNA polymerase sigma-70 factor (ECF subfamily)